MALLVYRCSGMADHTGFHRGPCLTGSISYIPATSQRQARGGQASFTPRAELVGCMTLPVGTRPWERQRQERHAPLTKEASLAPVFSHTVPCLGSCQGYARTSLYSLDSHLRRRLRARCDAAPGKLPSSGEVLLTEWTRRLRISVPEGLSYTSRKQPQFSE